MKIKKNDIVKIITGKDKGKEGKVIAVNYKKNKATIDGLNLYKKHVRPKRRGEKGQIISTPRPVVASNLMLVCGSCRKATRISYKMEGGNKQRVCKKCKAII